MLCNSKVWTHITGRKATCNTIIQHGEIHKNTSKNHSNKSQYPGILEIIREIVFSFLWAIRDDMKKGVKDGGSIIR